MKRLLTFFLSILSLCLHAQSDETEIYDTARRIDPISNSVDGVFRSFSFINPIDSSMLFFSQYDRMKREHIGVQNTGDIGMAYISQSFSPEMETGFITGFNPYGRQFLRNKDLPLHSARLPYTEFQFAQGRAGQRGLVDLNALHTQNFGQNIGVTVKYHSVAYDGFYANQSIVNKNLSTGVYYRGKGERYIAIGTYAWNKANSFENGGIERSKETDTFFRSLNPTVRVVNVMLNDARNITRMSELHFRHAYALLRKDSVNQLFIAHHLTMNRQSNYYTDQAADYGYYDSTFYFRNNGSTDSIGYNSYSNAVEVFTPINGKALAFKAGIQYDKFTYSAQAEADNYFIFGNHNTSIYSQFNFDFLGFFVSQADARLFFEGYNAGDYQINWTNKATLSKEEKINFIANLNLGSRRPGYMQSRHLSNHYVYQNNFENTAYKSLTAGLEKGFKRPAAYNGYSYSLPRTQYAAYANYHLIDNYIYHNLKGLPEQGSMGQSCFQLQLSAHFNIRKFQIHQEFMYQAFSRQLAFQTLLPNWLSKGSYYFQTYAFKKATFVQIGFDATMTSSYQARIYNPGIMQFQLSDQYVGAYPFIDFFIHAEVKTARVFFRIEHLNSDLPDAYTFKNYMYVTPYYPASPRRFRIGFSWKFYY